MPGEISPEEVVLEKAMTRVVKKKLRNPSSSVPSTSGASPSKKGKKVASELDDLSYCVTFVLSQVLRPELWPLKSCMGFLMAW